MLCPLYDHQAQRWWRHLDTCQLQTILDADPHGSSRPEHGARPSVRLETFQYEGCNLSGNRTQSGNSFTEARTTEHPFVLNLAVEHKGTGLGLATAHKWRRIERR